MKNLGKLGRASKQPEGVITSNQYQ